MPLGPLERAFAYEVAPRQAADFVGGPARTSESLFGTLESTYTQSGLERATTVDFVISDPGGGARANPVRTALTAIAFGSDQEASQAGTDLAARFGWATDRRSKASLFVATIHGTSRAQRKQVILWTFPQQEVFRLRTTGRDTTIDVLDVFSRDSPLRKAAMFVGGTGRSDLLSGRALDFQSGNADRTVSDLWIVKFLEARLQMTSDEGTRLLARSLRYAHDKFESDPEAQAEIQAAIVRLRNSQATRVTLAQISGQFSPPVAAAFRSQQKNEDALGASFELRKDLFDSLVEYRIYALNNGVWVSAPFGTVGSDVTEDQTPAGKRITATGIVETERVRSKHG
jgi:hypothetical protein